MFRSFYISGSVIYSGVYAWHHCQSSLNETMQLSIEKGVGLHDDQFIIQSNCMIHPGLCAVVRRDAPIGCIDNGKCCYLHIPNCLEEGRWYSSKMNGFFLGKFWLWHGRDVNNMFWDPGLGTPTDVEDPGLYLQ